MTEKTTVMTAEEITARKIVVLNNIFDMLLETTGIHGGVNDDFIEYHRGEFMSIQLRNESFFASEYWFPATASDNMKLFFDTWRGFSVITQDRHAEGNVAAEKANARLLEMGYRS